MVFNSVHFVVFFAVVYAVYRVLGHRAQNLWLLAASYYFYAAWDWRFTGLLGLNTLFVALMDHPDFKSLDFSHLKLTNSGGTALVKATAERWEQITGCRINFGQGNIA